MIKLLQHGEYRLTESKGLKKILDLSEQGLYVWLNASGIGEILVPARKKIPEQYILSQGKYRVYQVKGEPELTDTLHLELLVGEGRWQGYLLLTGFPRTDHIKTRIIPTKELITRPARPQALPSH